MPPCPTDLTLTAWSGENKCRQSRVLSYTIPVTNPLGPKAAAVIETQVRSVLVLWGGRRHQRCGRLALVPWLH